MDEGDNDEPDQGRRQEADPKIHDRFDHRATPPTCVNLKETMIWGAEHFQREATLA
jgi:hypothetical protein